MCMFLLYADVDENKVKLAANTNNVIDAIKLESGYLHKSGIYVDNVEKDENRITYYDNQLQSYVLKDKFKDAKLFDLVNYVGTMEDILVSDIKFTIT